MCAKFDINKTFNFKVMTLDPLYCNYPSARDCKNIWGNALF